MLFLWQIPHILNKIQIIYDKHLTTIDRSVNRTPVAWCITYGGKQAPSEWAQTIFQNFLLTIGFLCAIRFFVGRLLPLILIGVTLL